MARTRSAQQGSVAVEFALLVPVFTLLFSLFVGGGRVWYARTVLEQMAASAARAVSVSRDAATAEARAREVVLRQAETEGLRCASREVTTDTAAFAQPAGRVGVVSVRIRCVVPLPDVLVPGWPGLVPLEATGESVLERYRMRT